MRGWATDVAELFGESLKTLMRSEIYDKVLEFSAVNPENTYTRHECNNVCNGEFHHDMEEEREEIWCVVNGAWDD